MIFGQEKPQKTRVFSKSLKKMLGMTTPIAPECTQYIQRSHSYYKHKPIVFPSLHQDPLRHPKTHKRSSLYAKELQEGWMEEKGEQLRSTNQTSTSKLSHTHLKGTRSGMEKEVDQIMNEVISAHSPELAHNSAIKRSISTKKFKNVRVMTDGDDVQADNAPQSTLFIKQILSFILKHSKPQKREEEAPEVYKEDLSKYSPIKLVKKSQEILGLSPMHEFKRESGAQLRRPLNSDAYIKQLRAGKLFVRELHLKRH